MIDDPASGYLLVGTATAVLLVVSLFDRWLLIAVFLVLGVIGNQLQVDLNLRIDDQSVSPADLAFTIGAIAAGLRMIGGGRLDRMQILWLGLTIVALVAFIRGMSSFGFEAAATSYRYWFYLTTGALFVLSFPWGPAQIDRLAGIWLAVAGALALIIVVLWIDPDLSPLSEDLAVQQFKYAYENQRVVAASTAFLLGQAGLIGLAAWLAARSVPLIRASGVVFLIMMVLLYHRSVWVAIAAGVVTLIVLKRGALYRLGVPLTLGLMLLVGSIMLGQGLGRDLIAGQIDSAIDEALDEDSTLTWRVQGWEVLLGRALDGGPAVWTMGAGFGVGYERRFGEYATAVSPHNLYIELFINTGLLGLGLWLWFQARILRLLYAATEFADPDLLDRSTAIALMMTTIVFCLPYSLSIEQSIWLGALGGLAARAVTARTPEIAAGARPV